MFVRLHRTMNQEQKQLEQLEQLEHLEMEGERKVAAFEQAVLAIIDEGNDAFKAVHGRNMTYAEMRGLYG